MIYNVAAAGQNCIGTQNANNGFAKVVAFGQRNWPRENYLSKSKIVTKQMFREVQAEIARRNSKSAANRRKRKRGRYNSKYALSERLFCGECGSPYKRVTWNIHGRKQVVWRCVNRVEYGKKFCPHSPSIPEEELHQAILKAIQDLAANFTNDVANQLNGLLQKISSGENETADLQKQLEQTQQEFSRLLDMSLDLDENTPFLDAKLKSLSTKIKKLRQEIQQSKPDNETTAPPERLISEKNLQLQTYDDLMTARVVERITVLTRYKVKIEFVGGLTRTLDLF